MIINQLSNKILKEKRIIGLYEAIYNHGPNCMCHAKLTNRTNPFISNSSNNNNNNNNSMGVCPSQNQSYSSTRKLSISEQIEKDRSRVMDSNYFNEDGTLKTTNDADYAFEMAISNIRFGSGCTYEVGYDLYDLGCKNVVIFTDGNLVNLKDSPVQKVVDSINKCSLGSIKYTVYDRVSIEPTGDSFKDAIAFMDQFKNNGTPFDGVVAVGGGSVIDTAKAANLYCTYPPENFLDYVNPPIGKGIPVPGPLKPLIAIPTTCGTGSETTGVAVFDLKMDGGVSSKTGIAHRRLKPTLGLVDPDNLKTIPPNVAISSGFDQLCHALESFTAIPFNQRVRAATPLLRPAYQGSNPISDVFSLNSLETFIKNLPIFINDPNNQRARNNVMLAASLAGIGFGNGGVTIPHALSYSISSMVKNYKPEGYHNLKKNLIPHGQSVIIGAPAAFRFLAPYNPERHLILAKIMGANINVDRAEERAGELLSAEIIKLMKKFNVPNGLQALGYTEADIPKLVEGTLPQHRVLKLASKQPLREDLEKLFKESMSIY
ncbi:hypothetical protein DICPUDRAFT_51782 [Dictyostelium purpureum]|uniref:hydroxyacid-oxoacid transhydrogenase n=1 Tax=Dictyostelium purpureum TaxID=5786 RepID=F1A5G4_DICPU|nr:uncharacterized protein DICPUDRAFT_51782 [Dictyostelium purpureum]EGC28567.1 hypothetical protein DICPUDRAFT_51782 [Dictyostelium purpureum]|eukprot:XP_003294908.1 hypothetical protein DICPUDRAFT_51782 [Dictyostelium purpureum]